MAHETTVHSFAELADLFQDEPRETVAQPVNPVLPAVTGESLSLGDILHRLERASATLVAISRRDEEARNQALSDLERYDAASARQREAEAALAQAQQLLTQAQDLAESAFADEAREAAQNVVAIALEADQQAAELVMRLRLEADDLADSMDVQRLLHIRQQREEQEKAKAAEAEQARQLAAALTKARSALAAGRVEEARAALRPVASVNAENADVASLLDRITQEELGVRAELAAAALVEARRCYRRETTAALAHLEGLEVEDLPDELRGQVFGQWIKTCARLCRQCDIDQPLRYTVGRGRGAVLARTASGAYQVFSALGMGPRWQAGNLVSQQYAASARSLY
ncbi:MAG: hypothetical protein KGJ86_09510 [Chloroflexota bacterium]|nr:hypothetical protein [Chloroflexota bacterium]